MFEEISARNLLGETGLVDEVIVHTVKLAGPRCARRERHRDCRGDAVPGDCRHQCAREAGLAAAARCRNDEEKDPKRVVEGKSVSVRVDLGGGWVMKTI